MNDSNLKNVNILKIIKNKLHDFNKYFYYENPSKNQVYD